MEICHHEMLELGSGSFPFGDMNVDQRSSGIDKECETPARLREKNNCFSSIKFNS